MYTHGVTDNMYVVLHVCSFTCMYVVLDVSFKDRDVGLHDILHLRDACVQKHALRITYMYMHM
jgi:hypothetical protein